MRETLILFLFLWIILLLVCVCVYIKKKNRSFSQIPLERNFDFFYFFYELSCCWCVWERRRLQSARGIWTKIYKQGTKENEFSHWCHTDNTATCISGKTKTMLRETLIYFFYFYELSCCWCVWERRRLQSARGLWTKIYKHGTKENEFSQWCDTDNSTATCISSKTKAIIQHNTWLYPLNLGIKWWDNCWNLNKRGHSTKLSFFFDEPFHQTIINWEGNLVHMIPVYAISLFTLYIIYLFLLKSILLRSKG